MKAPGAAVQGGLAALGLIAAYTTWQRAPERKPGEVVIIDATASDVQKIRYEDKSGKELKWVELERHKEADGPHVWLRVAAKPESHQPERELRGNESAQKLWDKFAPLKGSRALGVMPPEKLKEVNLDAPKKRIEVIVRGSSHALEVGASPFGVSEPYVKDVGDNKVYVLGNSVVSDLDSAAVRLVDRQLHDWKPAEIASLTIKVGDKTKELKQVPAEGSNKQLLVDKSGKSDDRAKMWHDKLGRALVSEVLGKGEVPPHGEPAIALRVDYKLKGRGPAFIEVGRSGADPASTPAPGAPPVVKEIFARTESTAGWVKLSVAAEELLKDAEKIVVE